MEQTTKIIVPDGPHGDPAQLVGRLGLPLVPKPEGLKAENGQPKNGSVECGIFEIAPGTRVETIFYGPYLLLVPVSSNFNPEYHRCGGMVHSYWWEILDVDPKEVIDRIEPVGTAFHQMIDKKFETHSYGRYETRRAYDTYGDSWDYGGGHGRRRHIEGIPYNYLNLRVTMKNGFAQEIPCKFERPDGGVLDLDALGPQAMTFRATNNFFGLELNWEESILVGTESYSDSTWKRVHRLLNKFEIKQGKDALWARFFQNVETNLRRKLTKGVKAVEERKGIKENLARLAQEEPLINDFYGWLHDEKTRQGVSNNSLLAAFLLAKGTTFEGLRDSLREAMHNTLGAEPQVSYRESIPETRNICLELPGAKDKDEEKRAKKEWYLRKSARDQAIGLGVSPESHPKLLAAIERQDVPLNVFHKSGDQLHLINVEFDLWEKAFERKGWEPIICSIAQNASSRSTYEKNITPYLAFLFRIEGYLDRHTGKGRKWKSMPKFVQSEWELEMAEANEEGTVKKRSALTPVADNEARTIEVPYIAMRISGVRTTFCYSLDYQVFEENTVDRESGTPIVHELEEKLNGRDDYGLMYYTLTGTPQNTGYPSFLIIFERRRTHTHVHFHRVHPNRSKEGKPTPACRLIQECYRYMAGNIRAEEIFAQQGDLIFIQTEQAVELVDPKGVREFESHAFKPNGDHAILLTANTAKSIKNRLGFIYSEGPFRVEHPEHDNLEHMPAGMYEVRRCKSWEANPKAVWSLTID